jgi:hypothetical protein
MTINLNSHRLLKAYQTLAAKGYPGGPPAFLELADLAGACLANVTSEQRLPAMILQNVFVFLSHDLEAQAEKSAAGPAVSPEVHTALLAALKFIVTGGSPTRCIQVSEALIDASRIGQLG